MRNNQLSGVLCCRGCKTKEDYKGSFIKVAGDNGGGWGKIKVIGNCPKCNYPYAVIFTHSYLKDDDGYFDHYVNGYLNVIIESIEDRRV